MLGRLFLLIGIEEEIKVFLRLMGMRGNKWLRWRIISIEIRLDLGDLLLLICNLLISVGMDVLWGVLVQKIYLNL